MKPIFLSKTQALLIVFFSIMSLGLAWGQTKTIAEKIAAKEQLTNVPTLYFTISSIPAGADINAYLKKENNVAEYLTAVIQVVDKTEGGLTEFTDSVEIKVRGNSTAKVDKKPYRLKFAKDEKDANGNVTVKHKHDLLGRGYSKRNWALLANYEDATMVRNALTYKVNELVGMPFNPGYKFADVVINGEYRGTYQITDHVEVGTNRIDIDEETGWYLESSRGDMVEQPSAGAGDLIMSIKNPEPATDAETTTLKNQIETWFKPVSALFGFGTTFNLDAFTDPKKGWRKYWNEESLVNFYLGINITGDYDGFMTVKMYREVNGKMKFGPIWDKDLAYGNWSSDTGKILAEDQQSGYFTSYVKKLWQDPVFVKKVHDKMETLVVGGLTTTLQNYVDALITETAETEALNHTKWTKYGDWASTFSTREAAVAQLKSYLALHITWLKNTIDTQYQALGGDAIVDNTGDSGDDEDGTDDVSEGLEYLGKGVLWGGSEQVYLYTGSASSMCVGTTMTVELEENGAYMNIFADNQYTAWASTWGGSPLTYTRTLTSDDVAKLQNANYTIKIAVFGGGTCKSVSFEGGDTPAPATRSQLTNLPTIYLDATVGDDWSTATLEVFDKDNKLTQGTAWTTSALSVQYQGSSAAGSKNSYRLKFDSKTKLLASGKFKQWVLASNDDDPSMINNALTKELGDALGMPFTPGYQFVDLYVNNEYQGTYQVTDRVKAESGRALVSGGNKDNDWHVQFDAPSEIKENDNSVYVQNTDATPYIVIKNPDPDDLTAEEIAALKQAMSDWFTGTNSGANFFDNVADYVDKNQLFSWYIGMEILCSYKGLSSIEAYRSVTAADQKLHLGPFWDSEKAFGNAPKHPIDMTDLETEDSYQGLITEYSDYKVMRKWLKKLWRQKWFAEGVIAKWNTLYGENKSTDLQNLLKTKATAIAGTLAQTQAKNAEKWTNSLGSYTSYTAAVGAVSTYLDSRFPYLDAKFNELYDIAAADLGDVNVDGVVNNTDVTDLGKYLIKNYTGKFSKTAADVNGDGKISLADLAALVKKLKDK